MPDTLNVPLAMGLIEIDPQKMENVASVFVNLQIHRGLMKLTPQLETACSLAKSYDVLSEGPEFNMQVRQNHYVLEIIKN